MDSTAMTLTVYVLEHCRGCERARQIARAVHHQLPDVRVRVVNLADGGTVPSGVVGVPAYVVNGRVVSHGNPRLETLVNLLTPAVGEADG